MPSARGDLINPKPQLAGDVAVELLLEAGAVLATSLDVTTTIGQVARLTVPRLADLCVIDLVDEDGSIRKAAAAGADERVARGLEEMRRRSPVDPDGQHPVAEVIRSGEPQLLAHMSSNSLKGFAQSSDHASFMIANDYRSAIVSPLLARGRTLGTLSLLRLGECEPYGNEDLQLGGELARRAALAIDNAELFSEVKRGREAEHFMAEASRMLASSMDYGETLQRVARLAVPQIADWCAVDVMGEHGELERVAVHHSDPEKLALAERLHDSYRPGLDEPGGVPDVIRTGQARIFTDIRPEALAAYARDEEHLRLLKAIEATAVIIVPLAAPARTIGAITLVSSESGRRLTEADLGVAVRLGRRAGTAVESARLYTERTRIADILQASLLPESLPEIPGVELEALYRAAGELNDVGGDFYDVFPYGSNRWMLVIGDVCGKGPRAAGVTALARHTLRTAARLDQSPSDMLATLHRALRDQPLGADLCTVCLVTLERTGERARLTVALAGHPPPLIIDAGGEAAQIGRPGTLLGVLDQLEHTETEAELRAGETLLLYTDGLPEAGSSERQLGEGGLSEMCRSAPELSLGRLLESLVRTASARAGERLRDDIALIGARLAP
jgi:serine phosphatase RsbU (regulator of sigma subunit)